MINERRGRATSGGKATKPTGDATMLEEIAKIINETPGYWAEVGDDEYLIRFNRSDDDGNNLVLMSDYGVTWEPYRAYPTPRYCRITLDDAQQAAKHLMLLADAILPSHCPDDAFQHLIT